MKFIEALQAMQDGKVCKNLKTNCFYTIINNQFLFKHHIKDDWDTTFIGVDDCLIVEWEIIEIKQELYQWRYKIDTSWRLERRLFSKAEAIEMFKNHEAYEIHAGPFTVGGRDDED